MRIKIRFRDGHSVDVPLQTTGNDILQIIYDGMNTDMTIKLDGADGTGIVFQPKDVLFAGVE